VTTAVHRSHVEDYCRAPRGRLTTRCHGHIIDDKSDEVSLLVIKREGVNLRILAFSDVEEWKGYEKLVDRIKPDLITLAGDVTSDGFASFWKSLEIRKGKRTHVDKFYKFLRYAGEKSQVLVVKGDHDADFDGDYIPEKINEIYGCQEISGKLIDVNGLRFLGLGFNETHYLRALKVIIEEFKEEPDVVVTHCEQKRMPLVSSLKPRIIIRGHFGSGKYLVNDIPAVFTQDVFYTVVELENKSISKILQYTIGFDEKVKVLEQGSCRPWLSNVSEYEKYEWLKPYRI